MGDINPTNPPPQPATELARKQPGDSVPVLRVEPRLRLWPALILLASLWILILGLSQIIPGTFVQIMGMMFGPPVVALLLLLWWLFFSRIPWKNRLLGLVGFCVVGAIGYSLLHSSLDVMGLFILILPAVVTTVVLWFLVSSFLSWRVRQTGALVVLVLTWGFYDLVRFEGVTGNFSSTLPFRWVPTAGEKHRQDLAAGKIGTANLLDFDSSKGLVLQPGDWPGFRGPNRDSRLTGVKIATDWGRNPPKELWRHRVGPGWSSFTVIGRHLFTQEQLDKEELVVCYDANTGKIVWTHKDAASFEEKVGGPGPRATPTFHEGKLYVQGATGILNCLDAAKGSKVWSRNIATDADAKEPMWGFASSPLVVQNIVTVFAGGPNGKTVMAYHASSGEPAWHAGEGIASYCSLQPARLKGAEQILLSTEKGLTAFEPVKGEIVWNHIWDLDQIQRVVQPAILSDSDVLLGSPFGNGTRRVRVGNQGSAWNSEEVWTTRAISPYFNDLVVHGDHLYGFDSEFLTCVSLDKGKKKWRERGYGTGQVLLLADQNLLLVVSETGAVALVEATPDGHKEIAQFQALTGKTWNHPVIAHGKLFVRNSEEAACFQLTELPAGK